MPKTFDRHQYYGGKNDATKYIEGVPQLGPRLADKKCPNCGCEGLFQITVEVKGLPGLNSERGTGTYVGCAACPFASPMVTIGGGKKSGI